MQKMPDNRSQTIDHIKAVALGLFAEHGIEAVSIRQIAEAAGQKNHAAVGYYFGSKEELVRAIIVHGARLIDECRNAMLDQLEQAGGPATVHDITRCLVRSSLPAAPSPWNDCYNRFITVLNLSNRDLFMEALEGRWNSGYQRCIAHLRHLLKEVPPSILNQRLIFMGAALGGVLAARESELSDQTRSHPTWASDATLDHLARSIAGMLTLDS